MDNYRSSAMHYQNQGTNTNANGGKNRNRKKKNKQNKNQNLAMPPSNNIINHYDDYTGSMSLDHQSFGRPFSQFPSNQNYVYNNRAKYNNGKFNKRRNGSQSNYYSSGTYENDRLNKSLTPNSSFGENQRIQTSISLDNFDLVSSLNAKRSPSSSYPLMSSNVVIGQKPNSPFKNGTYQQHQQIIEEQANLEEMSEKTTSLSMHEVEAKSNDVLSSITSTESLNTSGDFMVEHHTPLSNYSTPMNHSDSSRVFDPDLSPKKHREHEESLNQNDKTPIRYDESEHTVKHSEVKSDDSSALSTNSSPDSKNSDQNLVTASEGESSFTNEQMIPNHQEHNLARELEKIAANFELNVHKNQDTESNKSVNGSADSSATESYATTSNERDDEMKESEHHSNCDMDNEHAKMEQLVIQEVRLEHDDDKREETVIEERIDEPLVVDDDHRVEYTNEKVQCMDERSSDHAIEDLSLEEKKEQTVVEVDEAMTEQKQQAVEMRFIEEAKIEDVTQKSTEIMKEAGPMENCKEETTGMKKEAGPIENCKEESTEMKKEAGPIENCKEETTGMKKEAGPIENCKEESTEMKKEAGPIENCKEESTEMKKEAGPMENCKEETTGMKKEAGPIENCKEESTEMKKEAGPIENCKEETTGMKKEAGPIENCKEESTEMKKEAGPIENCKEESTEMKKEAGPVENCKEESTEMKKEAGPVENCKEESTEMKKEAGPVENCKEESTEIMKEAGPVENCKEESTEMKKEAGPVENCKEESTEIMKEAGPVENCKEESTEMKKEAGPVENCKEESTEIMKEAGPVEDCKEESTEMMNKDQERNEIEISTETIKEEGLVEDSNQKNTEQNTEVMKEKDIEEKVVDLCEVKVESEKLTVDAQSVDTKDEQNREIIIGTGAYEIKIRPHVEEINLTDGEQMTKQGSDLKIASVETDSNEQGCDEDNQEFEILEQSNDSIVSEPNDRTNTSINQKEPAVDCFSCTIV